jgi:hypothetical protein
VIQTWETPMDSSEEGGAFAPRMGGASGVEFRQRTAMVTGSSTNSVAQF